jgi:hypothetical protein
VLAPYDPIKIKSSDRLQAPSLNHPLGTDDFGRDILSRVIYGARISMLLGLGAVAISTLLAAIIGILSGYYGGRIDTVLQRCIDTMMAFPGFVVLLTIMAMLGQGWATCSGPGYRGDGRQRADHPERRPGHPREPVRRGGPRHRLPGLAIIARHILPNIAAPIMVVVTLGLGVAILAESALSFLGFGVPPPTPRGAPCSAARAGPTCSRPRGWPCSPASPSAWPSSGSTCWAMPPRSPRSQAPRRSRAPRVKRRPYS